MGDEKSIAIGCDDTAILSAILNNLKKLGPFSYNVMSASRVSDFINITQSLQPSLVIICFRNNQLLLNDFNTLIRKSEIPILCLTRKMENEKLSWTNDNIVFTHPLENLSKNCQHFSSQVRSLFSLIAERTKSVQTNSFAENAKQQKHIDDPRNMSRYVLELDQKTEVLLSIKERIKTLFPHVNDPTRTELISIVNSIKASASDNKLWDDFKLYFEKTNPKFLFLISKKHPELTSRDLKYCCYLKMNMSNDDIKNLLGINQESVRTHKYRLKKKMGIDKDLDLLSYINSIGIQESVFS